MDLQGTHFYSSKMVTSYRTSSSNAFYFTRQHKSERNYWDYIIQLHIPQQEDHYCILLVSVWGDLTFLSCPHIVFQNLKYAYNSWNIWIQCNKSNYKIRKRKCIYFSLAVGIDLCGYFEWENEIKGSCNSPLCISFISVYCFSCQRFKAILLLDNEFKEALFQMYSDKALGPNGLNPVFYRRF